MKRFYLKVLLFAAMLSGIVALCAARMFHAGRNSYLNMFPVKAEMIATKPSPKIVLVGGSNISLSVDCRAMSDSLGMPVINTGLNAAIGLKYMLDRYTPLLRRGDRLLICAEYEHYFGQGAYGGSAILPQMLAFDAAGILTCRDMNYKQMRVVLTGFPNMALIAMLPDWLQVGVGEAISGKHKNNALGGKEWFDDCGDYTKHLTDSQTYDVPTRLIDEDFDEDYYAYLRRQISGLQTRGVQVAFVPPSTYEENYKINSAKAEALARRLQADGYKLLMPMTGATYPKSMMYDSRYHLNRAGREEHTRRMIEAIRQSQAGTPLEQTRDSQ